MRNLLRRSETAQDVYEWVKNRRRRAVLRQCLPMGGTGAELGVHKGHLAVHLVKWLRPDTFYAVDPWYELTPFWGWAAGDRSSVNALRRVLKVLKPYLESGHAHVVIEDDKVFLARLEDASLDWVYLDSSHEYEDTVQEIKLLISKVKPGGVIAGDDWQPDPDHRHHGVFRAVKEFEGRGQLSLFYSSGRDHQWAARV